MSFESTFEIVLHLPPVQLPSCSRRLFFDFSLLVDGMIPPPAMVPLKFLSFTSAQIQKQNIRAADSISEAKF